MTFFLMGVLAGTAAGYSGYTLIKLYREWQRNKADRELFQRRFM